MKFAFSAAILTLALVNSAYAADPLVKAPMPREKEVKWDLDVFERTGSPFTVIKREVKANQIIWILENKRDLGTEIIFGYQAAFLDEDGITLFTLGIETEPGMLNLSKGERNRFILTLPKDDQWQAARKVVIKNGLYR